MATSSEAPTLSRAGQRHVVGLIGTDILGSLSPVLHEQEAELLGLAYVYLTFDLREMRIAADTVGELVGAARRLGFSGLNVTHPCKQIVIEHLDGLSAEAVAVNAVNTVVFREGRAEGHNTDWYGFGEALARFLPGAAIDEVVVLGAGGAGSAAVYALVRAGAGRVRVVDVDPSRAAALVEALGSAGLGGVLEAGRLGELPALLAGADGLVQATPVGMSSRGGMPVEAALLRRSLWVYDVVYRPFETELLRAARAVGCRTLNGGPMVVLQAAEAFRLFTGIEPDAERMLAHLCRIEQEEGQQ